MYSRLVFLVIVLSLAGCSTPQISHSAFQKSEPAAVKLLAASQRAQGGDVWGKVHNVHVRYEGKWAPIGPRFQPVLSDRSFRRGSSEYLEPGKRMVQNYTGPAGQKIVVRTAKNIAVTYNGVPNTDPEINRAAALVADAYTLFLTGPFYFQRAGVTLVLAGEGRVDGAICDQVLAVLRPGFGVAEEDRVLLSIDRTTRQLRRVRMTLNGLDSTQGAEVDVTFRKFQTIDGLFWPTDFDERIRVPFDLHAHHWKIVELQTNVSRR